MIELLALYPKLSISFFSFLATLIITLATKYFTDQNKIRELKEIQKVCQIKLKDNKGNLEAQSKIQKEIWECSMELMKHSFKPMLIVFIPLILIFGWLRGVYTEILPGWLWWYIGVGIASSIFLRKLLKVV